MTAEPGGIHRGLYGPVPDQLAPRWPSWRRSLAVRAIAWQARLAGWRVGARPGALPAAADAMIDQAAAKLAFAPLRPRHIPPGYRLVDVELVPGCNDLATFVFRGADGGGFSLSQRPSWLPVAEELALARVAFTTVIHRRRPYHIVHGAHGGEPIDHSFWSTRRSIACDAAGLVLELREIVGRGPGLVALLRLADGCRDAVAAHRAEQ